MRTAPRALSVIIGRRTQSDERHNQNHPLHHRRPAVCRLRAHRHLFNRKRALPVHFNPRHRRDHLFDYRRDCVLPQEKQRPPQRQLTLLKHIYDMANNGSQFIIATHSPILLGCPDARILSFDDNAVSYCSYEETNAYQITKYFINNKDRMLKELLAE